MAALTLPRKHVVVAVDRFDAPYSQNACFERSPAAEDERLDEDGRQAMSD